MSMYTHRKAGNSDLDSLLPSMDTNQKATQALFALSFIFINIYAVHSRRCEQIILSKIHPTNAHILIISTHTHTKTHTHTHITNTHRLFLCHASQRSGYLLAPYRSNLGFLLSPLQALSSRSALQKMSRYVCL
jgi:hypothetical protein